MATFGLALGLSCSSFLAAASMDAAAPSSSVSAITVGSSGSTHSEPGDAGYGYVKSSFIYKAYLRTTEAVQHAEQ